MKMDLRSQLAALFSRQQAPQQPDSPLVAQIPTGAPGEMLSPEGQVIDENTLGMQNEESFITKQNEDLVNQPMNRRARRAPMQDQAGLDELMMQLSSPDGGITEGPNANIGDDSRARALAQIAALRG